MSPERSYAWAQDQVPTASASLRELEKLEALCTPTQLGHRAEAFPKARRYVGSKAGVGVDAPVSRIFQDHPRPKSADDARVDIEVVYGRAFV
jgi:hypothetical protein